MSKWYGSLENRLEEGKTYGEIKVGTGVTEMLYSDRNPYEVVEVIDDRHLLIRPLDYKRVSGSAQDGSAEYEYYSNEDAPVIKIFKSKTGWRAQLGRKLGSIKYAVGFAERYYDPCF